MNWTTSTTLTARELQGFDGAAVILGEAMKPTVVKRRRKRSESGKPMARRLLDLLQAP